MWWPPSLAALCSFYLLFTPSSASALPDREQYDEQLTLRPLPDGRLSAHFTFTTLLKGAVPRAPNSLGTDDECEFPIPIPIPGPGL